MCHASLLWQRTLLIPLLVLVLTAPRVRAESPLEFIPEDAQIVARVKSPARVLQTVASWVPASSRDSVMPMVSDALNAMGQSADPAAECWVAQFFAKAGQKGWVYIVQANDVGKIKGSYTDAASHVTVGGWQVFAGTAALGTRINDCKAGKIASLAIAMDAKSRAVFDSGDVSVFINARKLRADYRNELDEWKRTVAAGLQPVPSKPGAAAGQPDLPAPVGGGIYMARTSNEKVSEGLLSLWYRVSDLIEDTDCVAAGLKVDDKGAAFEAYVAIAPKSRPDRFLARHPPSEMKPLELLPAGALAYFGLAGDLTGLSRGMAQLKVATLERKGEGVDARKHSLEPAWEGTVDGYFGSLDFGRDTMGPGSSTLVVQGTSAGQLREFENRLIETTYATVDLTGEPVNAAVKRNAETISQQSVDVATEELPVKPGAETRAMLRAFFGAQNQVEARTTNLPGFLLETTGGGRLAMARLLRNFETDRAKVVDPPWDAARRRAGPKANAILMLDLPRVGLAWFKCEILTEVGPANAAPQGRVMRENLDKAAPAFLKSLEASYSVAAVTTESHAARCRIYLPRQQVEGLTRFSEFVISTFEAAATPAAPVRKPAPKATVDDP